VKRRYGRRSARTTRRRKKVLNTEAAFKSASNTSNISGKMKRRKNGKMKKGLIIKGYWPNISRRGRKKKHSP